MDGIHLQREDRIVPPQHAHVVHEQLVPDRQ
jgi:hypothetical protein